MLLQDPYLHFWSEFLIATRKVANKIENVTDSWLRQEAYSYKVLTELETTRLKNFMAQHNLAPNQIKKLEDSDPIKKEYNNILRRVRIFKALHENYSDILFSRLTLKDEHGITAYIISIIVPEEKKYWIKKMQEEYPD